MPHCIIEYPAPLEEKINISKLVDEVFNATAKSGLFNTTAIKVRAVPFSHFKTGANQQHYINTTIKLLPGRTSEQKESLGKSVLVAKQELLADVALLSVEVVDISDFYYK